MGSRPTPFPTGTRVLLWRVEGDWQLIVHYPPGYAIPEHGVAFDGRPKQSLDAVYEILAQSHSDKAAREPLALEGRPERESLPDGCLVIIERREDDWSAIVRLPDGGAPQRLAPFASLSEVLAWLKWAFAVD